MKIAVLGAGIVGVTTAYELAADGHEVTVIEQHDSVAEVASFANAGVVAPGYVTPWAAPGMPGKVISHLLRRHSPVRLGLPLSGPDMAWIWKWWRACKPATDDGDIRPNLSGSLGCRPGGSVHRRLQT